MRTIVRYVLVIVCAVMWGCNAPSNETPAASGGVAPGLQAAVLDGQVQALSVEAKKLGGEAALSLS
jgi:hypothetical protein